MTGLVYKAPKYIFASSKKCFPCEVIMLSRWNEENLN